MSLLTKDQILNADDLVIEELEVPEWGGTVRVRTMTGAERDAFEESVFETKGKDTKMNLKNFRSRLVAICVVDDKGERMFGDGEIPIIGKKSAKALDRVFSAAQKLNGIGQKEVDELTKN